MGNMECNTQYNRECNTNENNHITTDKFSPKQYDNPTIYFEPSKTLRYTVVKTNNNIIEASGFTLLMKMVLNTVRYPNFIQDIEMLIYFHPNELDKTNSLGYTALMISIMNCNNSLSTVSTVKTLLQLGASPNKLISSSMFTSNENRGKNPLELAIKYFDESGETIQLLLQFGAKINDFSDTVNTVLENNNSENVCKILQLLISSNILKEKQISYLLELYDLYDEEKWLVLQKD